MINFMPGELYMFFQIIIRRNLNLFIISHLVPFDLVYMSFLIPSLSMALQPFGPWLLFQFLNPTHSR
jgi:hypothetical protein